MEQERETYLKLGKNIRRYRLAKDISQEKLSELLDANSKFIGHVERVERFVSLKKLIQISTILEVPLSKLYKHHGAYIAVVLIKYTSIIHLCQVLKIIFMKILL